MEYIAGMMYHSVSSDPRSLVQDGPVAFDLKDTDWTLKAGHQLVVGIGPTPPAPGATSSKCCNTSRWTISTCSRSCPLASYASIPNTSTLALLIG